ncbi:MAG: RlmE family RNA methyltransferase [Gammaproteobacteria bacterium]|jgi:23S rRNA (uridine2552-2'-O)-methyltransferase|nr:RlmE family RNA methyltransferase [Gammaproteobacteria bacterium]MBT5216410.1 RlmE family RNA methyltransferase [Gammaproteobacteria bacterium]MBT5542308.1 RlmE family RNA methyltransferase [Gammaproteobacteria bacterium]
MAKEHWRQKQSLDKYFLESKAKGFRSRSTFKLEEIDKKINLFKSNVSVLDLGSTPGGWSQYITKKNHKRLNLIANDINFMENINGVPFIQGDFTKKNIQNLILAKNNDNKFNIILSDISPNKTGNKVTDQYIFYDLVTSILEFSKIALINDGKIIIKVFHGLGFEDFTRDCRETFETVKFFKPNACRKDSKETYMIGQNIRYNSKK